MNETQILLTISHKKPLPEGVTDVIAARFYNWAYSQGCQVGVNAEIVDVAPLKVKEPEQL